MDVSPDQEPVLRARSGDVVARRLGDETVLLDLRGSVYLSTNGSGSVVWSALERGATRRELIDELLDAFDVDEPTAARDVDAFLHRCTEAGLLASDSATGPLGER